MRASVFAPMIFRWYTCVVFQGSDSSFTSIHMHFTLVYTLLGNSCSLSSHCLWRPVTRKLFTRRASIRNIVGSCRRGRIVKSYSQQGQPARNGRNLAASAHGAPQPRHEPAAIACMLLRRQPSPFPSIHYYYMSIWRRVDCPPYTRLAIKGCVDLQVIACLSKRQSHNQSAAPVSWYSRLMMFSSSYNELLLMRWRCAYSLTHGQFHFHRFFFHRYSFSRFFANHPF